MLTDFGRFLRKMRIDNGELIKHMSEKLGVTAAYLSAVETGKRTVPEHWVHEISNLYVLSDFQRAELYEAAVRSTNKVKFDLEDMNDNRRETAILFAREFNNADEETIAQIRDLLKGNKGGK